MAGLSKFGTGITALRYTTGAVLKFKTEHFVLLGFVYVLFS